MTYLTNKKAPPTAAQIAARLGTDNRAIVVTPDPATPANVIVASATAGSVFGVGPSAASLTNVTNAYAAGPPPVAAYDSVVAATSRVARISPHATLSKAYYRTQYFVPSPGQTGGGVGGMKPFGTTRKLCFVNSLGQPLDANGAPTTVALAIDAATTPLTARGQAVHNWVTVNTTGAGRTSLPGVYGVDARQTALYAPYVGWTAQNTPRANASA